MCHGKNPSWAQAFNVAFQIKSLKIQCPRAPECKWTGTYSDFLEHCNRKCELRSYTCSWGCGQIVEHPKAEEHMAWCWDQRKVICDKCSERVLYRDAVETHDEYCAGVEVTCGDCNGKIKRGELKHHTDEECPEVSITCDKCNGYPFKRKDAERHECPAAEVLCECGMMVVRRELEEHKQSATFALRHLEVYQKMLGNSQATIARLTKEKKELEQLVGQIKSNKRPHEDRDERKSKKKRRQDSDDEEDVDKKQELSDDSNLSIMKLGDVGALSLIFFVSVVLAPLLCLQCARYVQQYLV